MFKQLMAFEAYYQLKQRALPIFALIFFLYGFMAGRQEFAPSGVDFNSPYQIAYFTSLISLGCVFAIIFFAVSGVLRDAQHKMENIIYSTALKKQDFFWSRFSGIFLFSLLAVTPFLIGLASALIATKLDPERIADFNLGVYLWSWLIIIVPNVFVCSALIFSISTLTKNSIATYVSAVFIYMLYMIAAIFLNSPLVAQSTPASPEAMILAALADPFGISAFYEQTQFWTAFQKNTQTLSFSGLFMWNRIFWIGISFAVLAGTYRLFSFRKSNQKVKKITTNQGEVLEIKKYKTIQTQHGIKSQIAAFFSLLKIELTGVFKSLPFIGILICWLAIVFANLYSKIHGGGAYNESWYPFTNLLIELFVDPLYIFGLILIIFYSGELVWRERILNFSGIIDANPIHNSVFFLSKFVTLLLLPMILIASAIGMSIGLQLATGYFDLEIGQYLSLFYYNGLVLFVFAILALFVQSLAQNKYLGMGIMIMLIFALSSFATAYIGLEHPMSNLSFAIRPNYTNMTGFSEETKLFNHLILYRLAFCGILALVSFKLWQRGISASIISRMKALFSNWKKAELSILGLFVVIFTLAGAQFFYNFNIVNEYYTASEILDYRESYERKFKLYDNLEQFYRVGMRTKIDLYPNQGAYSVKANYILKNKGENPIEKAFITERVELTNISLENATLVEHDTVFGTYLFEFKKPIQPQEELKFSYELTNAIKGYEANKEITQNGTYITHRSFEPFIAYRNGLEIQNKSERKKRSLPKIEERKRSDEHLVSAVAGHGRVTYETIISTQNDEVAIASGELVKQWAENGRNYYHYKPTHKITPTMGYFSAKYKTQKLNHKGVMIEQYYDTKHDFNIELINKSVQKTLDYCINNFGNYSSSYIRIAEIPGHWDFGGFAHPDVISMMETGLYLIDSRNADKFNVVAKRTIHEVAHQWWGHILTPKPQEGASILIEGFAKYTEAIVMEKMYGKSAIFQLSQNANRRYFSGRAFASETEPPLYLVNGQGYLSYGKNYTAMLALRDLIGEQKLNQVLKVLADKYRNETEVSAYSLELVEELYKVTPKSQHVLVDDWFKRVITYDNKVTNSSYKKLPNGKYEVSLSIKAKRTQTLEDGSTKSIEIDEPIAIGIFSEHPSMITNQDNSILYLKQHQINKELMDFKFIIDELPTHIAIDPFGTRSDENLTDNVKGL